LQRFWSLAGRPAEVLALPSGRGEFLEAFESTALRQMVCVDDGESLIEMFNRTQHAGNFRIRLVHASVLATGFASQAFEFTMCLRYLASSKDSESRAMVLAELNRVTAGHVVISVLCESGGTTAL
jgi:hypothetical protein